MYGFDGFDFSEGAHVPDNEITSWVYDAIEKLKQSKEKSDYYYRLSGNTLVVGFKRGDEIDIKVCKNYFDIEIRSDRPAPEIHKIPTRYSILRCSNPTV